MPHLSIQHVALISFALAAMAAVFMLVASQVETQAAHSEGLNERIAAGLGALVSAVVFKKNRPASFKKNRRASAERMIIAVSLLGVALAIIAVVYTQMATQIDATQPMRDKQSDIDESLKYLEQSIGQVSLSEGPRQVMHVGEDSAYYLVDTIQVENGFLVARIVKEAYEYLGQGEPSIGADVSGSDFSVARARIGYLSSFYPKGKLSEMHFGFSGRRTNVDTITTDANKMRVKVSTKGDYEGTPYEETWVLYQGTKYLQHELRLTNTGEIPNVHPTSMLDTKQSGTYPARLTTDWQDHGWVSTLGTQVYGLMSSDPKEVFTRDGWIGVRTAMASLGFGESKTWKTYFATAVAPDPATSYKAINATFASISQ